MRRHSQLSPDHPLRTDQTRPWPYEVSIALRQSGSRRIVGSKIVYVRATSEDRARMAGLRYVRSMPPRYQDGKRLFASRPNGSRPLDKQDGGLVA